MPFPTVRVGFHRTWIATPGLLELPESSGLCRADEMINRLSPHETLTP